MTTPNKDRFMGSILGLAIGDALGAPREFLPADPSNPLTGYETGGPHKVSLGEWTDDTSQALCLAECLLANQGYDAFDFMTRMETWQRTGRPGTRDCCFDVGERTLYAIDEFRRTGSHYPEAAKNGEGAGCIMRLAPVAAFYSRSPNWAALMSESSSLPTHASTRAREACLILGEILATLISDDTAPLDRVRAVFPNNVFTSQCTELIRQSPFRTFWTGGEFNFATWSRERILKKFDPRGHCVDTLALAIWCFVTTESFVDAVLRAVNLGSDTDTNAAVTGQIAGAFYGLSGIPDWCVDGLLMAEKITTPAEQLWEMAIRKK